VEGSGYGLTEALSWHLSGGIEEHHEKSQVRTASALAKIRTKYTPENKSKALPLDQPVDCFSQVYCFTRLSFCVLDPDCKQEICFVKMGVKAHAQQQW
jgi:hypothetical protein